MATTDSLDGVVFDDEVSFETEQDYSRGVRKLIATIDSLNVDVDAVAIGLPGSISVEGVLDGSTNLSGWVNKPLKQELAEKFNCPVYVKNDAEMGALGESYFGQVGQRDFFYITWGTGVGCAQIKWIESIANVSRPSDRQPIYDLEKMIGGKNIKVRFNKEAKDLDIDNWNIVMKDLQENLPKIVIGYGYDTVMIGGGIAVQQKDKLKEVMSVLDLTAVTTSLKGKAGLYGAIALLKTKLF